MSGYAAPKLDTVRVGFIGLGGRGPSHLNAISKIEGTEIKALCDLRLESVNKAKKVGGHGSMDFIMDWRLIDCLRNGLPLAQDVYDAATWSSVFPLSEWSVNNRSNSVDVPDFTRGAWKKNQPHDIDLKQGGATKVKI